MNADYVDKFIRSANITSLDDIPNALVQNMYHMGQESEVFKQHACPGMKEHFNERALETSALEYLEYFVTGRGINRELVNNEGRVASICTNFADVAASVASRVLDQEIYILGCVNPLYAKGFEPERYFIHYLNAFFDAGRFRFFDTSVYKYIYNPNTRWWIDKPAEWNMLDIPLDQTLWSDALQTDGKNKRQIEIASYNGYDVMIDTFARKKCRPHFYQKVVYGKNSYIYGQDSGKVYKTSLE